MTALIIDTSGSEGLLMLTSHGKVVDQMQLPPNHHASKYLFPSIASFVKTTIDFVCVGKGPGTFTGTRVGAITAQMLAYGWKVPLFPFSSLLLPHLPQIAHETYQLFLESREKDFQYLPIELVYISSKP